MSIRLLAMVALIELLVAAPIAYWLMWRFAFRDETAYHVGNALIALTFVTPIALGIFIQRRRGEL